MATKFKPLNASDIFVDTSRITSGIFSNGVGTLAGSSMYTSSISSSNKRYYYAVQDGDTDSTATKRFDVAYGHIFSSGSDLSAGTNAAAHETKVVYKQFANILLNDPHGKFFRHNASASAENREYDDDIYILSVDQDVIKDELDQNWTLTLSASKTVAGNLFSAGNPALANQQKATGSSLILTNYTGSKFFTQGGPYYSVISGSGGTPHSKDVTYGNFWPDWGIIVLSATKMSESLNGPLAATTAEAISSGSQGEAGPNGDVFGLAPDTSIAARTLHANGTHFATGADNAHKFRKALGQGSVTLRSVQNLNQTIYYCRAFHNEFNFSSNPTYTVSGSQTLDIISAMRGDPVVYPTTVGLLNSREELLAVAKLSQPQKKSHSKEIVFGVKVDG